MCETQRRLHTGLWHSARPGSFCASWPVQSAHNLHTICTRLFCNVQMVYVLLYWIWYDLYIVVRCADVICYIAYMLPVIRSYLLYRVLRVACLSFCMCEELHFIALEKTYAGVYINFKETACSLSSFPWCVDVCVCVYVCDSNWYTVIVKESRTRARSP